MKVNNYIVDETIALAITDLQKRTTISNIGTYCLFLNYDFFNMHFDFFIQKTFITHFFENESQKTSMKKQVFDILTLLRCSKTVFIKLLLLIKLFVFYEKITKKLL